MSRIRTAVVDDEALARERIVTLLRDDGGVEVVAECANGRDAVAAIRRFRPALVFLDVQMPELDGFEVLQALSREERPSAIVFVTAYDRYAIRAFDVNALDYLLKPYTQERFEAALERARSRLAHGTETNKRAIEALLKAVASRASAPERLAVRSKDGVQLVRVAEIDWLQADGNYTQLHVGAGALRIRETISDLEERLAGSGFIRVHRSVLVNVDRILRLEPWSHGEYLIVLRNGTKLNSGRGYGEQVRRLFD